MWNLLKIFIFVILCLILIVIIGKMFMNYYAERKLSKLLESTTNRKTPDIKMQLNRDGFQSDDDDADDEEEGYVSSSDDEE
jgi:hypothetical protein